MTAAARVIRSIEIGPEDYASTASGIDALYNDALDVIVARQAFPRQPIEAAGNELDRTDRDPGWARPNEKMPTEDIQILGTHAPATPTYSAPRGASLDTYLESASSHRAEADRVFVAGFDPVRTIERVLGQFAGGRSVELPVASDGRAYAPFTLRRLADGRQIGLHHDYHYPLDLYKELAPLVDTRTLVSWVVTLRKPTSGGELSVYGVTPDTPNPPKMPNGFQWDLDKVERDFDSATYAMEVGDLFLLASGRCLHRVRPIAGPQSRVTMGGFLALAKDDTRVLYWS
jgi:hypothetical protein